ncbi:hypothetical protein Tco_1332106 [Tanacetum coccineum]
MKEKVLGLGLVLLLPWFFVLVPSAIGTSWDCHGVLSSSGGGNYIVARFSPFVSFFYLFCLIKSRIPTTISGKNVNTARPKAVVNVVRPKAVLNAVKGNQQDLQDQGVIDSGCSSHMTGNMSYLTDFEEINGGYVAFGELQCNLFSVSQMCDKKNSVLFNDTECIVLSPNFKLTDESHVLLKDPRKNNMYSVDLKNIVHKGGLTYLFAKATSDESKL